MIILVTGGSGFLGGSILENLKGNEIETLGRSSKAKIHVDLSIQIPVLNSIYDIVIHAAGKAHSSPKTEIEKKCFFDVNVNGTANLLQALQQAQSLPKSFVFISTVAVYGCESGLMINEDSSLNAKDPYGLSKIQAEQLVQNWCAKNKVTCTILRLPLLVGENPPGNLGAMIKGIRNGYYFNIAGGKAKKSMVMASDVAKFISEAAEIGGTYNLTDGYHPSFDELSAIIAKGLNKPKPINIPLWLAKIMAGIGDLLGDKAPINSSKLSKIITDLTFDDTKAREALDWQPMSVINNLKM